MVTFVTGFFIGRRISQTTDGVAELVRIVDVGLGDEAPENKRPDDAERYVRNRLARTRPLALAPLALALGVGQGWAVRWHLWRFGRR